LKRTAKQRKLTEGEKHLERVQRICHAFPETMNNSYSLKRLVPFPFVLDELLSIRPIIKTMFGFTYVYLDEKLLISLRDSVNQPGSNGIWVYTTTEHLESLAREFPQLPRRQLWRSGKNAWVVLASRLENFEEHAFTVCELILKGDQRIGRITRGKFQNAPGREKTPRSQTKSP
jgi:hypothetical protein